MCSLLRFVIALVARIFGGARGAGAFELKSAHAIVALPGARRQAWHRDDGPLFPELPDARARALPPYALNAFVALEHTPLDAGPPEFLLGSHRRSDAALNAALSREYASAALPLARGSVVLMDYRTGHRGGANLLERARTIAMLVYGRPWWRDAVNYDDDDFGGAPRPPEAVEADGGGPAPPAEAAVVARGLARATRGSDARRARDGYRMLAYCARLWHSAEARAVAP